MSYATVDKDHVYLHRDVRVHQTRHEGGQLASTIVLKKHGVIIGGLVLQPTTTITSSVLKVRAVIDAMLNFSELPTEKSSLQQ